MCSIIYHRLKDVFVGLHDIHFAANTLFKNSEFSDIMITIMKSI